VVLSVGMGFFIFKFLMFVFSALGMCEDFLTTGNMPLHNGV